MLILERLRGDIAVIFDNNISDNNIYDNNISDDEREFTVPAEKINGCREGDVIILSGDAYITDSAATEKRRRDILSLQNSLWEE